MQQILHASQRPDRMIHRPSRALVAALAGIAASTAGSSLLEKARVVVAGCGGDDGFLDQVKRQAIACAPAIAGLAVNQGCGVDANGNPVSACKEPFIYMPMGGQQTGALAAAATFSVVITVQALFYPVLLSIPDNVAGSIKITSITYATDSMLKSTMVTGGSFSNKNTQGGYRLRAKNWLYPQQTITIAGTAVSAIAADNLMIDVYGLTPS